MSGTKGHIQSEEAERLAKAEELATLNANRKALLSAVAGYMQEKYGDDSFFDSHPLVSAILRSVNDNIIDLPTLVDDIANFQLPETV